MKVNYIGKISEENLPAIFVPYFLESVHAGFPSPASDYIESPIDLNRGQGYTCKQIKRRGDPGASMPFKALGR